MTSFIVAGGMGAVVSHYLHSTAASLSFDKMLTELGMVVQPFNGLGMLLPALFGFFGGTLLLLFWKFVKTRMVRYLLQCNMWFLKPKHPVNKIWYILMVGLLGKKQRGAGRYQDFLPSLPVPSLRETCKKYLKSVRPLLTDEEYKETVAAVKEFEKKDGKKLQWFLKFRSWRMRNWMAKWWIDFIYLRQRTPISFNSNYFAADHGRLLTPYGVDRAATIMHRVLKFGEEFRGAKVENVMGGKLAPFCAASYKYLYWTTRVPGKETDRIVNYGNSKPKHFVVYRQGKYYMIEGFDKNGCTHPPKVIKKQLEQVIQMAGDVQDETGVAAFTALPRSKWAEIRDRLKQNETNKRSLRLIDSSAAILVLDTSQTDEEANCNKTMAVARHLFHGNGYNRWFDKSLQVIITDDCGVVGASVEHSSLDATVCGQMWEYVLSGEKYNEDGHVLDFGQMPNSLPTPTVLRWELDGFADDLAAAKTNVAEMIKDSDLCAVTPSYSKGFPKKCKLSPDGWFQMAVQLAYYRLHGKFVLTYESATTRLYFEGRTETIRPISEHSVAFVKSFDDATVPREEVRKHLSRAIVYQCDYKMEAMRGLGVDRHLFGLYIVAKAMNLDPMPKMFSDKAFNLPFGLSTSQTPVKTTERYSVEKCTKVGGFGTVTDEGYGVSYLVISDDEVNFCVHSKRSCPDTDSKRFCEAICKAFDDMRALFEN